MAPRDCCCGLMTYRRACMLLSTIGIYMALDGLISGIRQAFWTPMCSVFFTHMLCPATGLAMYAPLLVGAAREQQRVVSVAVYSHYHLACYKSVALCVLSMVRADQPGLRPERAVYAAAAADWFVWYVSYHYLRYLLERTGRRGAVLVRPVPGEPPLDLPPVLVQPDADLVWYYMSETERRATQYLHVFSWLPGRRRRSRPL